MSVLTVNGTIDNPEPFRTHEEPASPYSGGSIAGGITTQVALPGFKNTGNVPQGLQVAITNVQGVTVTSYNLEMAGTQYTDRVTMNPGFSAILRINIQAPNVGPAEDSNYSFDIETTWT